ncbi:urease accessory protein UreE [Crenobacter intestini]|uniref:Urease accessory protein UreE n=1 Tax=Crenobacter intestini TaxID=2563443 RepID=A0A4T0V5U4_9NEIS|nr:urease accessory protein UreE [Crenobacter intestini]TIC87134.1 urease accessory protein UreE [Crenobacter intestini]
MLVLRSRGADGVPSDRLVLDFERRCKMRLLTRTAAGEEAGVMLPPGSPPLRHGERLQSDDGRCVEVCAADEALLHVECPNPRALACAAYHLGNRHVKVEVGDGWLRLASDEVLAQMLGQMGLPVVRVDAAFQPEHGAYGGGHHHSHGKESAFHYAPMLHLFGPQP